MQRALPSLNALRAFEIAAQHLSFAKAADELNVTPSAVSHQVRGLEDHLGTVLFQREQRLLRLTAAGQALLPGLTRGFRELEAAVAEVTQTDDHGPLTVSASPSFAGLWLIPRIEDFRAHRPDIEVRIDASTALVDFERDGIDIAIRYGAGNYPGLVIERLLDHCATPVCSPELLERTPLETPEDIRNHTLIHMHREALDKGIPSWGMWAAAAGVTDVDTERGPRVTDFTLAVEMALAGHGVALVDETMVSGHLDGGRLVRPFEVGITGPGELAFYLVAPKRRWDRPKVTVFRNWLLEQATLSAPNI